MAISQRPVRKDHTLMLNVSTTWVHHSQREALPRYAMKTKNNGKAKISRMCVITFPIKKLLRIESLSCCMAIKRYTTYVSYRNICWKEMSQCNVAHNKRTSK